MKILITGDFSPHGIIVKKIEKGKYKDIFSNEIRSIISSADLAITNLETSIISPHCSKSNKVGINIGSELKTLDFLKDCGFSLVTLANNHFMDYGNEGASFSFRKLKENDINYVGAGNNENEISSPFVFSKNGCKVGIINACEREFIGDFNSIHCNCIDAVSISRQIKKLRGDVDKVILIFHGGDEHSQIPRPGMVSLYRFFVEQGADIVINHHQHCYSGYEKYQNGYIFYGLGNFCFYRKNEVNSNWNKGFMLQLMLSEDNVEFEIIPYIQCNGNAEVRLMDENEKELFNKNLVYLNKVIKDEHILNIEYNKWLKNNQQRYISYLSPYGNKLMRYLSRKKILPSFIKGNHAKVLYLIMSCDSHREAVINTLKTKI